MDTSAGPVVTVVPMTLSRRHFLSAAAGGAIVTATGAITARADGSLPVDKAHPFASAAAASGVPASVLAAFSWAQSRWDDHEDRPSTSAGYGPMHLIDGAAAHATVQASAGKQVAGIDTLGEAARASGIPKERIRTDPASNIAAAAALIAANHKGASGSTSASDPASWYLAVADSAGLVSPDAQIDFADQVMAAVSGGVQRTLPDGTRVSLSASRVGSVASARASLGRRRRDRPAPAPLDAPDGLDVAWVPAPYVQYGSASGDYGNHDRKPNATTPKLRYVVIHDTECSFDVALKLVQDPTYLGWHYTVRSHDGHIAEHLRGAADVGWHAGNWYINQHSIGVEHEGYMAQGAAWYSEPMYRASARLVSYLCREHGIPIDRAHILGHDMVPGVTTANIPGMHVDPGPYWNWEHYFNLLGAPLERGTATGPRKQGKLEQVVRILPRFATNRPEITGCSVAGQACAAQPANFLYVHTAPDSAAALVADIGMHADGRAATHDASDVGARATAGQDYVTIERRGEWLAIWYLGQKGWIHDPDRTPRTRVVPNATVVRAKAAVTPHTYGRCYPEASAYASASDVQAISPLPYVVGAGQAYVVTDAAPVTDYYKAKTLSMTTPGDHIDVVGKLRYLQISYGARAAFVRADEVTTGRVKGH